jgi:serine/threonine protein kinase
VREYVWITIVAQIFDERWQVVKDLREGGQAHTFLVSDLKTGGLAVLKRLKNPNRLPRFEQEVAAIKSLDHPRVLRLLDANTAAPKPYLVSEHCELGSLEDQKAAILGLPLEDRLDLFAQICEGVAAAHRADIIHRDLKPSNVFARALDDLVVGDFGVCFIQTADRLTETIEAVGARYYMAPELADGRAEDVTPAVDVYSLGKILYWFLTGNAFDREDHRRSDRLLTKHFAGDWVLHIHKLLDAMITYDRAERISNGYDVVAAVAELKRRVDGRFPTLEHPPRRCRYCGIGTYKPIGENSRDTSAVFNFGFSPTSPPMPHIFVCTQCGHVEMFMPSRSASSQWLGP